MSTTTGIRAGLCLLTLALVAQHAAHAATTLDADGRGVETIGFAQLESVLQTWNDSEFAEDFILWSAAVEGAAQALPSSADGAAWQDSFAMPTMFGGSGGTSGSISFADGDSTTWARSYYEVDFTLDTAMSYTFSGSISALASLSDSASFELITLDLWAAVETFYTNSGTVDFAGAGILGPGSYRLLVQAATGFDVGPGNYESLSTYEFELKFAAVPLPAGVWLLIAALGSLGFARRR